MPEEITEAKPLPISLEKARRPEVEIRKQILLQKISEFQRIGYTLELRVVIAETQPHIGDTKAIKETIEHILNLKKQAENAYAIVAELDLQLAALSEKIKEEAPHIPPNTHP